MAVLTEHGILFDPQTESLRVVQAIEKYCSLAEISGLDDTHLMMLVPKDVCQGDLGNDFPSTFKAVLKFINNG